MTNQRRNEILAAAKISQARRTERNRALAAAGQMIPLTRTNTVARIARDLGLSK